MGVDEEEDDGDDDETCESDEFMCMCRWKACAISRDNAHDNHVHANLTSVT